MSKANGYLLRVEWERNINNKAKIFAKTNNKDMQLINC